MRWESKVLRAGAAGHDDDEDLLDQQGRMLATSLISLPRALGPVGGVASAAIATLLNGENYQQRMPAPPVITALLRHSLGNSRRWE